MKRAWCLWALVGCGAASGQTGASTPGTSAAGADPAEAVFGEPAWRMPTTVDAIAFTRDEQRVVVVGQQGAVAVLDRSGQRVGGLVSGLPELAGASWLSEHELALTAEAPIALDLRTGRTRSLALGEHVAALAASATHTVVGTAGASLRVVRTADGAALATLAHSRDYRAPAIVGPWVIAGRGDRAVGVWELATGHRHRVFALGNGGVFALSPDRALIAAGSFAGRPSWEVDVYEVDTGARVGTAGFGCHPSALAFSPDSTQLAIACDDELRVVRRDGAPVASWPGPRAYVRTLAWSPSGALLAAGGNDNVLHLWRVADGVELSRVVGSRGEIRALAVRDRFLITQAWGDGSAWLWVTDGRRPVLELGGARRELQAAALGPDGALLALSRGDDGGRVSVIERWHGSARAAVAPLPPGAFGAPELVRALGPVPGGGAWIVASGRVRVLDAALHLAWTSPAIAADALDARGAGSPDGRRVILADGDTIASVDAVARRELARRSLASCGGAALAVAPDGAQVAVLDRAAIRVLDTRTLAEVGSAAIATEDAAERAIAWASATELVAIAGADVVRWRPGAAALELTPIAHATAIAVDGGQVYVGRADGTVLRRSLGALGPGARRRPATAAPTCTPDRAVGWLGALGVGGPAPRGRLDDSGSYDEPDAPAMPTAPVPTELP